MKLYKIRKHETDIHILEFNPMKENLFLTSVGMEKRTVLSKLKHAWFVVRGYKLIASFNGSFFNYRKENKSDTCGVDYRDRGFVKGDSKENDAFMEAIWLANKLYIDDITIKDIPIKYKNADWAISLGYTLVLDGEINIKKNDRCSHSKYPNPRTMLGQRNDGTVIVAITDGRTHDDRGLTASQQAELMKELNALNAINCDGGGSSELIVEGEIINKLAGGERALAQAFLIYGKEGYKLERENKKYKVCLDAGHGINTPGKRTPQFNEGSIVHEAEQNYPVMFKVAEYLKFNNIDTILTNSNIKVDMSLKDRVNVANKNDADIFISIHKNASKGTWQTYAKGISTYVHKKGYNAEKLAKKLQQNLIKDTEMTNRGIKEWEGLYVTKYTKMPAALVELGFMDYKEEALQMQDKKWHDKFARAIVKGICEYFGMKTKFPVKSNDTESESNLKIKELEDKVNKLTKDLISRDSKIQELNNHIIKMKVLASEIGEI